jgi:hypothetical protein
VIWDLDAGGWMFQGAAIIAYAAYCQVDQYDRPVAGYINFCPSLIQSTDYDEERIYLVSVTGMLNMLLRGAVVQSQEFQA